MACSFGSKEQASSANNTTDNAATYRNVIISIHLRSNHLAQLQPFNIILNTSNKKYQKHFFFVNGRQHQLRHSSTPLFSAAAAATAAIRHLDDDNMRDLLFSTPPDSPSAVLVDAYTQWCGPCKLIEPLLITTANKYSTQLSILKYDVEGSNHQNLKVELLLKGVRVSGLPTLILFWRGEVVASHSGVISEEGLEDWLDVHLFSNDELLNCESVDVGSCEDEKQQQVNKRGGEEEVVAKRGFVSFASQFGRDDYALSTY
eukprot:CAMPEP_0201709750 /NCGR_PEP_ID=MMETSP0578-20130828/58268_1 /ASSEMBLY_ACC=CAM_ASM_000663 /TAXON_ID=267565 /ORGANISM="Skeletonema grethea, Strain CCMP 1804" /LENGTH=258 /DNA_ID=CAMNT_0048198741 /DNA_START=9 /DNA_END=786 /DNA_ORIENTATION=-